MVDPQGMRVPWHLLLVDALDRGIGYVIEHSHRTAGWLVGLGVVVLALGLGLAQSQRWLRWLGIGAFLGISAQGLLGKYRVDLNALMGRDLALVHGLFAQVVFSLLVSIAWLTSRKWGTELAERSTTDPVRWWSLATAGLVYIQILFGAVVRHTESPVGPRGHLLMAFVVVAAVTSLVWAERRADENHSRLSGSTRVLIFLVGLQLMLGAEAWLSKFVSKDFVQLQPVSGLQSLVRSLHYLVGSLVFAASVVTALRAWLLKVRSDLASRTPESPLEGAA